MKRPDPILAAIAREHLSIPTLETRRADSLDFYDVAVWQVEAALKAAFNAGKDADSQDLTQAAPVHAALPEPPFPRHNPTGGREGMAAPKHSPAPWSYDYSPYRSRQGEDGIDSEIPAFEIVDADYNKIFDTNEDSPCELQEANARMAATSPRLLASLVACANLLADYDESDGEEGEAYREAVAAIAEATGRAV
jgi:hypothetical protein